MQKTTVDVRGNTLTITLHPSDRERVIFDLMQCSVGGKRIADDPEMMADLMARLKDVKGDSPCTGPG